MPIQLQQVHIRPIIFKDNDALAKIIRSTLQEFGAAKPGTVYFDPTTDALFELFGQPRSRYFVATHENTIVGGGGIYPTAGLPADTCELVKMYLIKEARGIGLGKLLIQKSLNAAAEAGFTKVYLETMPELKDALKAYERLGFKYLDGPMGSSGHFGCGLWMMKEL